MLSDHYQIKIEINKNLTTFPMTSTHTLNTKNLNWDNYTLIVEKLVDDSYPEEKLQEYILEPIENKYKFISNTLIKAVKLLTPKKKDQNIQHTQNTSSNPLLHISTQPQIPEDSIHNNPTDRSKLIKNKLKIRNSHLPSKPPWWNEEATSISTNRKNLEKN